jgi:hypothetical protein
MRLVPIVLLLANVLLAASFLFEGRGASSEAPRREIHPESIRIVHREEPTAVPAATTTVEQREPAPALTCATWGGFTESQAATAEGRLAPLELGARLSRSETAATTNYLVIIPPIAHRPTLNARVDELKRAGIVDQFVISDGDLRNGISLGFFKSEEAANRHLAYLQAKGVADAVVKPRPAGNLIVTWQIRNLTGAERATLESIASGSSSAELKFQPCPEPGTSG